MDGGGLPRALLLDGSARKRDGINPQDDGASPTKCRKSCGFVPEADAQQADFHKKTPAKRKTWLDSLVAAM